LCGCVLPWERQALLGRDDYGIGNVQGPTERRLRNLFAGRQTAEESPLDESGALKPIPGTDEYLAAEQLYEQGDYKAAEAAFKKVARKFKKSDIREDALFMQAESAYQQKHYADANDLYAQLLKEYPSTRHLDEVTRRLFEVARLWLDFPQTAGLSDVQQVDYDELGRKLPAPNPPEKKRTPVFVPNFFDETRPTFDTEGNAISALRLIWLNDPTGPLADDALMMTASHYARRGNWIEADRHYTLLREEYPTSPHVQTAFIMGSHVKLMSYDGPAYDGKVLEDARHLKESTLRLYPASEDRARLERELEKIEEARAAREWQLVEFYDRKNNPRAQAVYCHIILDRFPNTSYASRAREHLEKLGPEYASGAKLLQPLPDPERKFWAEPGSAFRRKAPSRPASPTAEVPVTPSPSPSPPAEEHSTPADDPPAEAKPAPKLPRLSMPGRSSRPSPDDSGNPKAEDSEATPSRRWEPPQPKYDRPATPGRTPSTPAPQPPRETADSEGEEEPPEGTGSRWSRLLRFTPPRRLRPDQEAQPAHVDPAESTPDS
jgi:TolA-binding protein